MWPWAHAAFGYLLYTVFLRERCAGSPAGWPVLALGLGTQVPDLVDKPLAWYLHVLPYGRTFAHTLFVAVPVILAVGWYADARGHRDIGVAFAVGYLSHLLGDALHPIVTRSWVDAGFLLWPLVEPPAHEVEGLITHLSDIEGSPFFLFGLGLTGLALLTWQSHGRPGLRQLRALVGRTAGDPESL